MTRILLRMGWKSRSICLRLLLVAFAIQGMTPDPQDLASCELFRLLTSDLATSRTIDDRAGCAPYGPERPSPIAPKDNDRDGLPDEVCGLLRTETLTDLLLPTGDSHRFVAAEHVSRPVDVASEPCPTSTFTSLSPPITLTDALCRLTC